MHTSIPEARSRRAKSAHKTHFKTSDNKAIYITKHPAGNLSTRASFSRVLDFRCLSLAPISSPRSAKAIASKTASPKMQVVGLNHFNITAAPRLIEQVKQFYIDIVGLKMGARAHLDHEGYWLYAGAFPILHLSARPKMGMRGQQDPCPGYFNHISLGCRGLKSTLAKLTETHTPYRLIELIDIKQTQLFVTDPAGIGVELTFFNERV